MNQRDDYEALASVIRKLVNDETCIVNEGGYLVVDDSGDDEFGSRCIDLTPAEMAAVKEALRAI